MDRFVVSTGQELYEPGTSGSLDSHLLSVYLLGLVAAGNSVMTDAKGQDVNG